MKIIHTADIHLDSPLSGVKNAALRRHELLSALDLMSAYADQNGVEAIIVAGDLFDDKCTSDQTVASVAEIVKRSRAVWYVLRGNHAGALPYVKLRELCSQICFFNDEWTAYEKGDVVICGRELGSDDVRQWGRLALDPNKYNILVLHGDADDASYGLIDKRAIAASGADYVALGHRHAFAPLMFGNVKGCYCGVLEARGFDESADTGFVLIDTQTDKVSFVPQAIRKVITRQADVSACASDIAVSKLVSNVVADADERNYINLELVGTVQNGVHLQLAAKQALANRFFAERIKDCTHIAYDVNRLMSEVSLRGEFVKAAYAQIADEQLRDEVIKMGLSVMDGENIQ